jgi:hypothetical protein
MLFISYTKIYDHVSFACIPCKFDKLESVGMTI